MLMILRGSFQRRAFAAGSRAEAPSPEVGVVLVLRALLTFVEFGRERAWVSTDHPLCAEKY